MDQREALDVLGLRGPVAPDEVKRAYRRLARELHPDAGGDPDRFRRVQAAFDAVQRGSTLRTGPVPQQRAAAVDERWWDAAGRWHEDDVDHADLRTDADVPADHVVPMTPDRLATLLVGDEPVSPLQLRSRSPGSLLHRMIGMLQPDLLASLRVHPAPDGPRANHDVEVVLEASAGKGRRVLADAPVPPSWTRSRGSETVRLARRLRPSRQPVDTAVRVTQEVVRVTDGLGWPLGQWFLLRPPGNG